MAHVVVVGAGLAGARTCAELRRAGFDGRLTLLGAEPDPPYDRPPLTKDPAAEVDLRTAMGIDVWALADEVRLGAAAASLRVGAEGVSVAVGPDLLRADAVVVATGAAPVLPTGWAGPRVHVLHTRAQAAALWERIGPGSRLEVVGGGWIGCEAAATARARGARVRLHEAAGHLLPGRVPAPVAGRVHGWLTDAGIEVRTGAAVLAVRPDPVAPEVRTAGGSAAADEVLVGLGVRPACDWLAGSGVERAESGAVPVDPWGRSSLPGVLAVGDAAARWSARAAAHVPGGHWTEALNAPAPAARAVVEWLAGGREPEAWRAEVTGGMPDPVPYVFSDIAGRTVQVLGAVGDADSLVWRESGEGWSVVGLDEHDRLLGVVAVGRPRDVAMARRLLAGAQGEPPTLDPRVLADPDTLIVGLAPVGAGGAGA